MIELPKAHDAEAGLLACCILEPEIIIKCQEARLEADAFEESKHQRVFEALIATWEKNQAVDDILLAQELQRQGALEQIGGLPFVNALTDRVDTTAHAGMYLDSVLDSWLRRKLIRVSEHSAMLAREAETGQEALAETGTRIQNLEAAVSASRGTSLASGDKIADAAGEWIEQAQRSRNGVVGIRTGLADLDRRLSGLQPGQLIVIAGRPGSGKSALAMQIAEAAALDQSLSVAFFSLEMSTGELGVRLTCSRARVDLARVRDNIATSEELGRMAEVRQELTASRLTIDDSADAGIATIRATARRLAMRGSLGLIVVDYLQLVATDRTDRNATREQTVAAVSRGLKAMAKELNVPVLGLSQLNRQSESDSRKPRLSDLRESGAIEQDSDVVLFIHHPEEDGDGRADLIIAKQRSGPVGSFPVTWVARWTRFENYTKQ